MQGQNLVTMYHPSIFSGGIWQCCGRSEKTSKGCKNYEDKYKKPLPDLPFARKIYTSCFQFGRILFLLVKYVELSDCKVDTEIVWTF